MQVLKGVPEKAFSRRLPGIVRQLAQLWRIRWMGRKSFRVHRPIDREPLAGAAEVVGQAEPEHELGRVIPAWVARPAHPLAATIATARSLDVEAVVPPTARARA